MGPPSPLEGLMFAWPLLLFIGAALLVTIVLAVLIQRSKRGYRKAGTGSWETFNGHVVAGFIDARPTNRPPPGDSLDRRFITLHVEYRDHLNQSHIFEDTPTRASAVREKLYKRFFKTTLRHVTKVNLNIHDPVEKAAAEEQARTEGYLMRLTPPVPATIYRSRDGDISWELA